MKRIILLIGLLLANVYSNNIYQKVYEAEKSKLINCSINNNHKGFTGKGFVDQFESEKSEIIFLINVPFPENYSIKIRYANSMGEPATVLININNNTQKVICPEMGIPHNAWDKWNQIELKSKLNKGINILSLKYHHIPINIDNITISTDKIHIPIPIITVPDIVYVNDTVLISAKNSVKRNFLYEKQDLQKPLDILNYSWIEDSDNPIKLLDKIHKLDTKSSLRLLFPTGGIYKFYLSIKDKYSSSHNDTIVIKVKNTYQLISSLTSDNPFDKYTYLNYDKVDNNYYKYISSKTDTSYNIILIKNNILSNVLFDNSIILDSEKIYKIIYYHTSGDVTVKGMYGKRFIYEPGNDNRINNNIKINSIALAGTFNNWNKNKNLFKKVNDRIYECFLPLTKGKYYYKIVINENIWLEDPMADKRLHSDDGNNSGTYNSGIIIGDNGYKYKNYPDKINYNAIKHITDNPYYFNYDKLFGLDITIRILSNDTKKIILKTDNKSYIMKLQKSTDGFDFFKVNIPVKNIKKKVSISYHFVLYKNDTVFRYPKKISLNTELNKNFLIPEWSKQAVWYQIMLDRFRNGNKKNDPDANNVNLLPWTVDWYKPHPDHGENPDNLWADIWSRQFGGDLQGLIEKLEYLKKLGINAIYFNPVFEANSSHKYDVTDFRHIDDNFGYRNDNKFLNETNDPQTWKWSKTDKLFLKFIKTAHKNGIKIIIDGVFNHTGRDFFAFKHLLKYRKKSKYKTWYHITNWGPPLKVEGWAGHQSLPVFAENEFGIVEEPKKFIFDITKRWMDPNGDGDCSDGIDGWRLDAADDININFWYDWCDYVRKINPDALTVGEIWYIAPKWLDGKTFNSVMNYPFADMAIHYFIDIKNKYGPEQMVDKIKDYFQHYLPQVYYSLQNLLSSHDTNRFHSSVINPDRGYLDDNNQVQSGHKFIERPLTQKELKISKLVIAFQMTFVGAPMIYYGDEVGMWGADDPSCRKPMLWSDLMPYDNPDETVNSELFKYYRKMIAIRNTFSALLYGDIEFVYTDYKKDIIAYTRNYNNNAILIVINNSSEKNKIKILAPNNKDYFDIMTVKNYKIKSKLINGMHTNYIEYDKSNIELIQKDNNKLILNMTPKSMMICVPWLQGN